MGYPRTRRAAALRLSSAARRATRRSRSRRIVAAGHRTQPCRPVQCRRQRRRRRRATDPRARPRRHVRGRRLVGGGRAAGRGRAVTSVGVWMRLHDGADVVQQHEPLVLLARRRRRRAARGRAAGHPVLRPQPGARVRGRRHGARSSDAYLEGRTPSPCVDCNSLVKFGALLGRARAPLRCDAVATGHYARVDSAGRRRATRRPTLPPARRARRDKDQSYFLYGLRQDAAGPTRFPLGDLTKPQVRDVARRHGLVTADKPESQEICFVPGGDYRAALRAAGWSPEPARSWTPMAAVGEHRAPPPTPSASAGPRRRARRAALRGCHRCGGQPHQLGRREDLYRGAFTVGDASFVDGAPPDPSGRRSASAIAPHPCPAVVRRMA